MKVAGARTTAFASEIGILEVGRKADLSLVDYDRIAFPYLDPATPLLDAVVQRAKSEGVRLVMCDGEVIDENGRFTRVDRDVALQTVHKDLLRGLSDARSSAASSPGNCSRTCGGSTPSTSILIGTNRSTGRVRGCEAGPGAAGTPCRHLKMQKSHPVRHFGGFSRARRIDGIGLRWFGTARRCDTHGGSR